MNQKFRKAMDLFKKMCCLNPEERIDAKQALNHPWISGKEEILFNPLEKLRIFNNLEKILEVFFMINLFFRLQRFLKLS